jgi:NTE family protein
MAAHRHADEHDVEIDGRPLALTGPPHRLSIVYGGGGVFGIGYALGVAEGLVASGIDVAAAPSLGTSAGSWVASALALGLTFEDFAGMGTPSVPTRSRDTLLGPARALFGDARHPAVAVSAVALPARRRHILDGGRYQLADLVVASSAVPGLFPPHRIEGRLYVDGGMWSVTSVDAAAEADEVIVIAPLAGPVMGAMGRTAGFLLARELRAWRARHPEKRITMIRPNRQMARMAGRNPLHLFHAERARNVHPLAREQGLRWGERLQADATAA